MSKKHKPNSFRHLDKGWVSEYKEQFEKKLNADHNWQPPITNKNANLPPIGGTEAIPLESYEKTER